MITRNPTAEDRVMTDERRHESLMTDEDHPTEFIVEGRDRRTRIWRRMQVHAHDKNAAIADAVERGVEVELVREAYSAERPQEGLDAPQREFGFGGAVAIAIGAAGVLSIAIALIMRQDSPTFALVVGILGAFFTLYGVIGALVFWTLSRTNRNAR